MLQHKTRQTLISQYATPVPGAGGGARRDARAERTVALSLFDDGAALRPWLARGYTCAVYVHSDNAREHKVKTAGLLKTTVCDLMDESAVRRIVSSYVGRVAFACACPPSRDLSLAGARHWKAKRARDANFQLRAVERIVTIHRCFVELGAPFFISNPATSQLKRLWRPPTFCYEPFEFGGYLDKNRPHPTFPDIVPRQDAYSQRHGLWVGGGFAMPRPRPVAPEWVVVRCRKTKSTRKVSPILHKRSVLARRARTATPRGFAEALCARHSAAQTHGT
jgi:hypothetical protein